MMKKFSLTIGEATRAINANEYNVFPKTGHFKATVNGQETEAATTSGKGKSAVNNHYIYFKDGSQIFYVKSDAQEVVAAQKGFLVTSEGAAKPETAEVPKADEAPAPASMPELMAALSAPVSKRRRVAKTA